MQKVDRIDQKTSDDPYEEYGHGGHVAADMDISTRRPLRALAAGQNAADGRAPVRRGGDAPLRHGCCGGAEESRLANYFAVEGKKVAALTAWIVLNIGFGVWAIVTWLQSPVRSQPPTSTRTRARHRIRARPSCG